MISASDYRLVEDAHKIARKAGFQLCVQDHGFLLVPRSKMGNRLMPLPWGVRHDTLEEAMAYCDGWATLERALQRKAGMGAKEVSDRMEQHRVLTALKGKGRRG